MVISTIKHRQKDANMPNFSVFLYQYHEAVPKMIDFIKENIGWIKDIVMLFFAGTGAVVTILAYKRARATILQPIRNEVIKKQSELLSEVLNLCQPSSKIDDGLDYVKLVQANVILHLRDYGFIFRNQAELLEAINKDITGWFPCGETRVLEDIQIIGSFKSEKTDTKNQNEIIEISKRMYEDAKKGIIRIDKIYLTKAHNDYMKKLDLLFINPFMPTVIQEVLFQLIVDVNKNLAEVLKNVLKEFVHEFFEKFSEALQKVYPDFDPIGVYNEFNHQRIHHRKTIKKLVQETRGYLRIDESWE
jgi:hypothetical protein